MNPISRNAPNPKSGQKDKQMLERWGRTQTPKPHRAQLEKQCHDKGLHVREKIMVHTCAQAKMPRHLLRTQVRAPSSVCPKRYVENPVSSSRASNSWLSLTCEMPCLCLDLTQTELHDCQAAHAPKMAICSLPHQREQSCLPHRSQHFFRVHCICKTAEICARSPSEWRRASKKQV